LQQKKSEELLLRNKNMEDFNKRGNDEIYSNSIRAGKRTYFFDVRKTRNGEMFLTITESKKIMKEEGNFHFEKHKIFLYKEDFEKFTNGLNEALDFISSSNGNEISGLETEYPDKSNTDEDELY
jgi:hypothetical protein